VFNQQIHGSKRSLRSVEDFTEFEQRTAYFNGDPIHAMKKGMNILDRIPVSQHGADAEHAGLPAGAQARPGHRPPRPRQGYPERDLGREALLRKPSARTATQRPSIWTTRCTTCTRALSQGRARGRAHQAFTLRGIKESPPYLHDGRCLTLEDTVEFFDIVLQTKLTAVEKRDLVAFMRQL